VSYSVKIDPDRCDGHAQCVLRAPSVFAIGEDDNQSHLLQEFPPDSERDAVEDAVDSCPKGALTIVEA
jgi:ferredoxin